MRIRKAAIAGATALAVAFSGTAAAVAEETPNEAPSTQGSSLNLSSKDGVQRDPEDNDPIGDLSSQMGRGLEPTKGVKGTDIFGADTNWSNAPKWAQTLLGAGIASIIITVLAGVVGPILNFIKFGPRF